MGHIGGHLQVPDIWHLPRTVGLGIGTVLRSQLSQELSGLMYQNPHDVFVRHAKHPFKQKEDLAARLLVSPHRWHLVSEGASRSECGLGSAEVDPEPTV